jgi:hypothetical protein
MKKYRFFYHYRKSVGGMTVHFKGQCIPVKDIVCNVSCETKWKKGQPYLVMQGFCKEVKIENNKAIIL